MLHALSLRKALRAVMFLLTCLLMTGCYTLKTVPLTGIPAERQILIVHADDNYWTVDSYSVSDGMLTGHIAPGELKVKKGNSAHLYVAPSAAVTVEGDTVRVPTANIAKTDYQAIKMDDTIGFGAIWAGVIFTLLLFFL